MTIYTHSIAYNLFRNCEKQPEKTAIVNNGRHISYKQLSKLTEQFTRTLTANGVKKGDILGVQLTDSVDFCALLFSASSLGAAIAPVDKTMPKNLAIKRFAALGANHIVSDKISNSINIHDDSPNIQIHYPELDGDETLIISLTSGSTSDPKPITLTQNNKLKRANAHIDLYKLNSDDVILASTPLYHSLAERLVIMSILLGATAVIMDEFKSYEWFNLINREKVSFTITDSSQLTQISSMLLSPFVPEITTLKAVVSSSSFLENHVKKELIDKLHCDLFEIYGTSESSTLTNINLKENSKIHSVGTPLKGVEIRIDEPDDKGIGEILCKSDLMFKGYFHNRELTDKAYKDSYFKTGDLGKIDEEGYLYYCGRKDELIKVNGINIYPFDIEDALSQIPEIKECAVFNYPDDIKGNVIATAIVIKDDAQLSEETVRAFCEKQLFELSRPEYVFFLNELPKNSLGKIQKSKIYEAVIRSQMMGAF